MPNIRICPFCKDAGQTSCLTPSNISTSTLMAPTPGHYDERGEWVPSYDPNWHTTTYSCSNGHFFGVTTRQGEPDDVKLISTTTCASYIGAAPSSSDATPGAEVDREG